MARNTRNISLLGSSYLRYKKSTVFRSWLNHSIIPNATTIPSIETQIRKYQSCQFHYYALIKPRCFPYHTETVAQYLRLKTFNAVRLLSSSFAQKNRSINKTLKLFWGLDFLGSNRFSQGHKTLTYNFMKSRWWKLDVFFFSCLKNRGRENGKNQPTSVWSKIVELTQQMDC